MRWSPCSLGEFHKTDFETRKCPDSYYTPHRSRLSAYHQTFSTLGSQEQWPPSHKAPTSAPVNPSTKPPSTDHILPAEPDKTWPGGSPYTKRSFQEKHTCCHIFPLRMCLNFIVCSVPVVIFHKVPNLSTQSLYFRMLMPVFSFWTKDERAAETCFYQVSKTKHMWGYTVIFIGHIKRFKQIMKKKKKLTKKRIMI